MVTEEAEHGAKSTTLNLPTPDAETADISLLPVNKETFIFTAKREEWIGLKPVGVRWSES